METTKLRRFAQYARRTLLELVEARLQLVLQANSAARRETPSAVKELEEEIKEFSRDQVIDRVAYIWFNRFCALRYMDINRVNRISVVSPLEGQFQPEILAEAKMGHIDEEMVPAAIQEKVRALLDGKAPSSDPQQEAYRMMVVAVCNYYQPVMPFLFERIADYTELLMPVDLLSGNSILAYTREAMTPDSCQDVEVIGWLYQFYISEKKDAVFEGLKKNTKITPENIPAATQLFTPHWIVRYLVENSLGRLWLLNRPNSKLAEKMDYYIEPQEPVTDFLRIAKPEDIKLCDPACGSGHMLTYAFDLLYAIYEEEGVEPVEIPEKILTYNLYGVEIDERAGELAAFALTMKALQYDKRFFRRRSTVRAQPVEPHICVLRPVKIEPHDLDAYMTVVGRDLFTANLRALLTQFEEADNFGSLIRPVSMDYAELFRVLAEKGVGSQLLLEHVHRDVLLVLKQAAYLSQCYQVVVANPPYMGSKGMNGRLSAWAKDNYPDSKSDLFAMFIERNLDLAVAQGAVGMITMQSWMFLSSYEKLRANLLNNKTISSMAHLGARAFDSIGGEVVSTTAFILENSNTIEYSGTYLRLVDGNSETEKQNSIVEAAQNQKCKWLYKSTSGDFKKIPGYPIAYWVSNKVRNAFAKESIENVAIPKFGMSVGDGEQYIRYWHEVSASRIGAQCHSEVEFVKSKLKWGPMDKGGEYRKWYGNQFHIVLWENSGFEIKNHPKSAVRSPQYFFKPHFSWTLVSSGRFSSRYFPHGYILDTASNCVYFEDDITNIKVLALLNSSFSQDLLQLLNPTMNFSCGVVGKLPAAKFLEYDLSIANTAVNLAKEDFDSSEEALLFPKGGSSLLDEKYFQPDLKRTYATLRAHWREMTQELQRLEIENNRIFIEFYGLQGEVIPEVQLSEITLNCNPHYRYNNNKSEQELEDFLRADTIREFISYFVGCLFGRFSPDKLGLILANQGETLADYLRQVPKPRFMPDEDNVIPLLDGDWFSDDITGRFREFLRVTFGDEHYDENLRFIEESLGKKGKSLPIRDFFLKEFYTDHVKRYKKRPIYWMFSSPKGSFNALVYLHRYRPDTASIVLQYLRDFRSKLISERDHQEQMSISTSASQGEKTKALKKIEELKKTLVELDDFERDTLYPLATRQEKLDLDDGVKVNYLKLGDALKKISGLDAKDEE